MTRVTKLQLSAFLVGISIFPVYLFGSFIVSAQSSEVEQLQEQIEERNARLGEIEEEIAEYEAALQEVGSEKETLQAAINELELERDKVLADIRYTENQIESTDLEINKLENEIGSTEEDLGQTKEAIAEVLRNIDEHDDNSLIEVLLRHDNLSEFWNEIETLETIRTSMTTEVEKLYELKDILQDQRITEEERREQLSDLRKQYDGQRAVLENNRAEKDELLEETKSEEESYQRMLEEKRAAREKLLAEVQDIESQLQFALDPNSIPSKGTAVFRWPLENVHLTQYFGYTKFALQNQGVYANNMHNGIDLGAPTGTNVHAPLTGTVRATGNTDTVPGCYSWGKWILIDHANGLTTLFAHLSHIGVSNGEEVKTGDLVGHVGNTGYSTGPHLHYTLYASDAVEVKQFNEFKSVTSCGAALSPFAAVEGYLDPLDYLPSP